MVPDHAGHAALPDHLRDLVAGELEVGEETVWVGGPSAGRFFTTALLVTGVGILFVAAIFYLFNGNDSGIDLSALLFVAILLSYPLQYTVR